MKNSNPYSKPGYLSRPMEFVDPLPKPWRPSLKDVKEIPPLIIFIVILPVALPIALAIATYDHFIKSLWEKTKK